VWRQDRYKLGKKRASTIKPLAASFSHSHAYALSKKTAQGFPGPQKPRFEDLSAIILPVSDWVFKTLVLQFLLHPMLIFRGRKGMYVPVKRQLKL
jgi:hypothetical protein